MNETTYGVSTRKDLNQLEPNKLQLEFLEHFALSTVTFSLNGELKMPW